MLAYPWPGNIRELRNVVEQTVLLSATPLIEPAHLPFCAVLGSQVASGDNATPDPDFDRSLESVERDLLERALLKTDWNVTHAARLLGISRDTLRYRIDKHRLVQKS